MMKAYLILIFITYSISVGIAFKKKSSLWGYLLCVEIVEDEQLYNKDNVKTDIYYLSFFVVS